MNDDGPRITFVAVSQSVGYQFQPLNLDRTVQNCKCSEKYISGEDKVLPKNI
jgi:hypothetical protein